MSIARQGLLLVICFCVFAGGCGKKKSEFFLATEKPSWWEDVSEIPDWWEEVDIGEPKGTTSQEQIKYILQERPELRTDGRIIIKAWSEFLERNPEAPTELRAKTQFVIANQYNCLGDFKRSIKEFWKYYENFALVDFETTSGLEPRGHAPHALFWIGVNFSELGDRKRAKRSFMECYQKHPDQYWGKRAKDEYKMVK